jgi:type IV pilus assembly protein PilY1
MKNITLILLLACSIVAAQSMNSFCKAPPFVGGKNAVVKPNVLISQDMTGSMNYNTNHGDYGYANPDYQYGQVLVGSRSYFKREPVGAYSGFDINNIFMTRIDVARKVLTGGKGTSVFSKDTLLFETPRDWNGFTWYGVITSDSTERSKGVIRETADTDDDFIWDEEAPNFALQQFSTAAQFGRKIVCPFGTSLIDFLNTIEGEKPTGATWIGDAVFEAIHYIRFTRPHYSGSYDWTENQVGTLDDPWYDVVGEDTVSVSCRPTFVIVISDGESNSDNPVATCPHLPQPPSPYGPAYDNLNLYNGPDNTEGTHGCADDYAYYAHVTDLRPDNDPLYGIPNDIDDQTITFYSIFLFADSNGVGAHLSQNIAKYGGFEDQNDNKQPDLVEEYDEDGDGLPDNYYYASEGAYLEKVLKDLFLSLTTIARITSASAGAVTSTTQGYKTGGLTFLAQFYPKRIDMGLDLTWIGRIEGLWLDKYGWIREETEGNTSLHLKNDRVVDMFFSMDENRVLAARFRDTLGTGEMMNFVPVDTTPVEYLDFVWDGVDELLNRSHVDRQIFTNINGLTNFTDGNAALDQHLDFGNAAECDSLINYIRGLDYPGSEYRRRDFLGQTWKLGDIIYSSPLPVGAPGEAYDLIYGDRTYGAFWDEYKDRRTVVYAGGNDGMLHAFNSGLTTVFDEPLKILNIDPLGIPLGHELWGYVPYNVLPHLKWLTDKNYCHVYYVDLKPYPSDVRIFAPDADHPDGWGTILVQGLRFGGSEIEVEDNGEQEFYRSSYSCLDITNPESGAYPSLLWEFTDQDLGFTLCIPVSIRVEDNAGNSEWYVLFGSGPQSLYGECTNEARIYVLDALTGNTIRTIQIPDDNTAITNIFAADVGLDYSVDLVYFGTYDNSGGGKIYRINTQNSTDPAAWTLHQVIDLDRPITAEGSIAADPRGNPYIYFGTGKYLSNVDAADKTEQLFVGIRDDVSQGTPDIPAFTLADLLDVTDVDVYDDSVDGLPGVSNFDDLIAEISAKDGWVRRFVQSPGERIVTPPLVFAGAVLFTTFAPSDTVLDALDVPDVCIGGGGGPQEGNLYALYYLTGTAYRDAMLGEDNAGRHLVAKDIIGDMPSEPAWFLEKIYVQTGGALGRTEYRSPFNPYGGIMLWRGR